jgi:hypothetical protein
VSLLLKLISISEKHCDNCLVTTVTKEDGSKVKAYYHKVLEKIVISISTELIENEAESFSKQDCEINVAKRLLKRLAKDYPRLPICIHGDNLYASDIK